MNSSLPGPCMYTTVLRPPLQRILSHYSYIKRKEPELLARECGPACDTVRRQRRGRSWGWRGAPAPAPPPDSLLCGSRPTGLASAACTRAQ